MFFCSLVRTLLCLDPSNFTLIKASRYSLESSWGGGGAKKGLVESKQKGFTFRQCGWTGGRSRGGVRCHLPVFVVGTSVTDVDDPSFFLNSRKDLATLAPKEKERRVRELAEFER